MRCLRLYGPGDVRAEINPVPIPNEGEVLVRVTAVGICGSDLHWFEEGGIGDARLGKPLVLGHEFAGVIASGPEAGTRVAIDPAISCGACRYCEQGYPNLCLEMQFAGHGGFDGALREKVAWPRHLMHPLPTELSDVDGAMLEPLGVAIHANDLAKIKEGDFVAVFGCGPIGLLILQVARAMGARIVMATDRKDHRLEAAAQLGAEQVVNVDRPDSGLAMASIAESIPIDIAFEASTSNDAVSDAVTVVRPGGRLVLAGIPSDNRTSFDASTIRRKALTIKLVRRMKHTYPRAIELATSGAVDLQAIVSHDFELADFNDAFAKAVQRSGLKVIIHPQSPQI